MQSYHGRRRGREFVARIIMAHLMGLTPEEFAEAELQRIKARSAPPKLCDHGLPVGCCAVCVGERKKAGHP